MIANYEFSMKRVTNYNLSPLSNMNAGEYPIVRYPLAWRHSIVTPTLASLSAHLPLPQTCLMAIFPGSCCLIGFRLSLTGPL